WDLTVPANQPSHCRRTRSPSKVADPSPVRACRGRLATRPRAPSPGSGPPSAPRARPPAAETRRATHPARSARAGGRGRGPGVAPLLGVARESRRGGDLGGGVLGEELLVVGTGQQQRGEGFAARCTEPTVGIHARVQAQTQPPSALGISPVEVDGCNSGQWYG